MQLQALFQELAEYPARAPSVAERCGPILAAQVEALGAATKGHMTAAIKAQGGLHGGKAKLRGMHCAVVYDVEGTTTPLPFVTQTLYPYAQRHLTGFLEARVSPAIVSAAVARWREPAAVPDVPAGDITLVLSLSDAFAAVPAQFEVWRTCALPLSEAEVTNVRVALAAHLQDLMVVNSKASYLKHVQGLMWRAGYEDGTIKGQLFADAARAMRAIGSKDQDLIRLGRLAPLSVSQRIYSSGSVQAQQLLFKHSTDGDLTPLLRGYHDTVNTGMKNDVESYTKIVEAVRGGVPESVGVMVVFVSDAPVELEKARLAGMLPVLSLRPLNNLNITPETLAQSFGRGPVNVVASFDQLLAALQVGLTSSGPDPAVPEATRVVQDLLEDCRPFLLANGQELKTFV